MTTAILSRHVAAHRVPRLVDEQGIRFGITHAALVAVALSAVVLHLSEGPALVLMGLTALAGGATMLLGWAGVLGISTWAFYTGFLENRLGQLTLSATDLLRLAALVCTALAGSLLRSGRHV